MVCLTIQTNGDFEFLAVKDSLDTFVMEEEVLEFVFLKPHLEDRIGDLLLGCDDLPNHISEDRLVVDESPSRSDSCEHFSKANGCLRTHIQFKLQDLKHDQHELLQRTQLIWQFLEFCFNLFELLVEDEFGYLCGRVCADLAESQAGQLLIDVLEHDAYLFIID